MRLFFRRLAEVSVCGKKINVVGGKEIFMQHFNKQALKRTKLLQSGIVA